MVWKEAVKGGQRTFDDAALQAVLVAEADAGERAQEEERVEALWRTGCAEQPRKAMYPVVSGYVMANQPVCMTGAAEGDAARVGVIATGE